MKKVVLKNREKVYHTSRGFWIYGPHLPAFTLSPFKSIYSVGGSSHDTI